jgi:predicted metalloprotease with PDZ domain
MKRKYLLSIVLFLQGTIYAQHPFVHWTDAIEVRYSSKQPVITYKLAISATDTSSYEVEMHMENIADTFEVAMMAHPEYDDRYWRFVEDISVLTKNGTGQVAREDSSLWRIITEGHQATLHYRIHLPVLQDAFRSSWKAFLAPTGGLVGGPHSFMYVVGATLAPSYVTLDIPRSWEVVTGLESTFQPNVFFAPSAFVLMDDPIFVGQFHSSIFEVNSVPHRVIYWPLSSTKNFDTIKLANDIQKLVQQAAFLFGRLPYREYTFMLQDGAVGALEHNNCVTVGAPSSQLATNMSGTLFEIAHEYFHTWNLVRIHPVEYADVSYKTPPLSKGLWFSEGLTMFYADLTMRRAGLPIFDSTRIKHLETLIRRYLSSPAYVKYSAEEVSLASYAPPGMLGDYSGSTHLQGEVLGTMLDLLIRDASNGRRSIDDVMRKMMEKFSGERGFTSKDVEQVVHEVCACNVHQFFSDYVFGHKQIDFNQYLKLVGLKMNAEWKDVLSSDNQFTPDLRVYSWQKPGENIVRLGITNPASCWAKAGLHTGDILRSVNGMPIKSARDFRQVIREVKTGHTVTVEVEQRTGEKRASVLVIGYQQPEVRVTNLNQSSQREKNLFDQWLNSTTLQH